MNLSIASEGGPKMSREEDDKREQYCFIVRDDGEDHRRWNRNYNMLYRKEIGLKCTYIDH